MERAHWPAGASERERDREAREACAHDSVLPRRRAELTARTCSLLLWLLGRMGPRRLFCPNTLCLSIAPPGRPSISYKYARPLLFVRSLLTAFSFQSDMSNSSQSFANPRLDPLLGFPRTISRPSAPFLVTRSIQFSVTISALFLLFYISVHKLLVTDLYRLTIG
jgi:hypothetical protein